MKSPYSLIICLGALLLTAGCAHWSGHVRTNRSSSIADFLYPKTQTVVTPTMPVLQLPLRVGVAFAPQDMRSSVAMVASGREELLKKVCERFRDRSFVSEVKVIPGSFLRPGGGFENLDQVGRMMNVDVVVLLSYDQVQFTDDTMLSLSYWTIVGAYLVEGTKNSTNTLIEAVVYDIPSRGFLFRAAGSHATKHHSTLLRIDERRRADASSSLSDATEVLIPNLSRELDEFSARVREGRAEVKVVHRPGYSGGGGVDAFLVCASALLGLGAWYTRRRITL